MKRLATVLAAGLVLAGAAPHAAGAATKSKAPVRLAASATINVQVGLGDPATSPGSLLAFTPKYVDISVGDTVAFKDNDQLEPHTVTFGPMSVLKKLADGFITPTPQKNGPPILAIDTKAVTPTTGHTYDGTGSANSGILPYGKTWNLQFTKPGTYWYICLVHGTSMAGTVTVHPAHAGHTWFVQAGDGQAGASDTANTTTNDSFYPRHLTVKVGDTVQWIGFFHTITFGPDSVRKALEKSLFVPIPGGTGAPKLQFNPKIAFPSGGARFAGTIFPGYPGMNTLRLTLPGNGSRAGKVVLVGTMPGMAMTPARAILRWSNGAYSGTVALPMFGMYRVQLALSAPSLPARGTMALTLPLPHP